MDIQDKLSFFQNMINCCHNLYFACYDSENNLLYSSSPEEWQTLTSFFIRQHAKMLQLHFVQTDKPLIIGNEYHMLWIVVPEKKEGRLEQFHIMGTFFTSDYPLQEIKAQLEQMQLSVRLTRKFTLFLKELPSISINRIFEYAVMFYYCITGEKISVSDLHYQSPKEKPMEQQLENENSESHGTYEAEQEMLRMVREGDLNYKEHMNKISMTGRTGKLSNDTSMRQLKNTVLVCVILFSRAAIEGGLLPEISYTLTDHYFQSIEASSSMSELMEISHTMQADFIERVHKCRQNKIYSAEIRTCIAYIDFHLEEDINISLLAHETGYADYYLSKKFKKETGHSVKDYILSKRVERAKFLLDKTTKSVQEIGEQLRFCSQSYFAETFRRQVGMTPTEYRTRS